MTEKALTHDKSDRPLNSWAATVALLEFENDAHKAAQRAVVEPNLACLQAAKMAEVDRKTIKGWFGLIRESAGKPLSPQLGSVRNFARLLIGGEAPLPELEVMMRWVAEQFGLGP